MNLQHHAARPCVFCLNRGIPRLSQDAFSKRLSSNRPLWNQVNTYAAFARSNETQGPPSRDQKWNLRPARNLPRSSRRNGPPKDDSRDKEQSKRERMTDERFVAVVLHRVNVVISRLDQGEGRRTLGLSEEEFKKESATYVNAFKAKFKLANPFEYDQIPSLKYLRNIFTGRREAGLDAELKLGLYRRVLNARFSESDIAHQKMLADLRHPEELYPKARAKQRKFHLHVGPTNSGKTYQALQRLEKAETGVYAGPLRLLAHEVYSRMSDNGRSCNLLTGDEQRLGLGDRSLTSCTVEMVPLNQDVDVAVIDEIQMLGDADRGWAWTAAVLGVVASEIHLCGEERAVPLVKDLIASCGDELEIHKYERLSPLSPMNRSLSSDLGRLRKGDCVVVFNRIGLHSMKREIEQRTKKRCAIIYGSLPPQVRAQQAQLFNEPDNDFDYLVASDAVGMGLNLRIKRIIFEAVRKFTGETRRPLAVSEIKQIGGRAGRYSAATFHKRSAEGQSSKPSQVQTSTTQGLVTTLHETDISAVQEAMVSDPLPLNKAGLLASDSMLHRFASYFRPEVPFSYVMTRLHELTQLHPRFHLCTLKDSVHIADLVQSIKGLSVMDRIILTAAPFNTRDPTILKAYARCIGDKRQADPLRMQELDLDLLERRTKIDREHLLKLENLHQGLVLYLWLGYRFSGVFRDRDLAFHTKSVVEERIDKVLSQVRTDRFARKIKSGSPEIAKLLREVGEDMKARNNILSPAISEDVEGFDNEHLDSEVSGLENITVPTEEETQPSHVNGKPGSSQETDRPFPLLHEETTHREQNQVRAS